MLLSMQKILNERDKSVTVDSIKGMYFRLNEFEVGVNEQQMNSLNEMNKWTTNEQQMNNKWTKMNSFW